MIICCPHCAFSRTVDEHKIPASAQTATCPKCGNKFRFRELEGAAPAGHAETTPPAGHPQAQADFAAHPDPYAPDSGQGATDHSAGPSEDIWDRVASLGDHWGEDDDADPGADPADETFARPSAPHGQTRLSDNTVPWEHIKDLGLLRAFGQTVWRSIAHPARFFSGLGPARFLGLAVLFYVLIASLQTYLFQAWAQIFPASPLGGALPAAHALYDSSSPLYVTLAAPLVWLLFLVAVAAASVLVLRVINGRGASVPVVMRIMAYASAPMLLGVIPFIGAGLGQIWAMLLFVLGCKYIFRLNFFAALIALLPVYLCLAVLRIILSGSF